MSEEDNEQQTDMNKQQQQQDQTAQEQKTEESQKEQTEQEQQQLAQDQMKELDEEQQASEQWLRRIPDDPSGLLRRKFKYQYQQRGNQSSSEDKYW